MNDFTKEELQEIIDMANDIHNGSQGHGLELHFKLRDKTQSMIDNYCKHESDGKEYCPGLYDKVCAGDEIMAVDLNRVSKCIKCHRYYE